MVNFASQFKQIKEMKTQTASGETLMANPFKNTAAKTDKAKRDYPWFTTDQWGNRIRPKGCFTTNLKFYKSPSSGKMMGFIHKVPNSDLYIGVRESDKRPKLPVVLDCELEDTLQAGTLYKCLFTFRYDRKAAVCIRATKKKFSAKVQMSYLKDIVYQVEVAFGNSKYVYDPKDGTHQSMTNRQAFIDKIRKADFIEDIDNVIFEVMKQTAHIQKMMKKDGYM